MLAEDPSTGAGPRRDDRLSTRGVWHHATRVLSATRTAATTSPSSRPTTRPGARSRSACDPPAEGVIGFDADGARRRAAGRGARDRFRGRPDERYLGFGERSQAVDQRGNVVENYVADGPYQRDEWPLIEGFVPPWGFRPREDATYYPVPWLLSTAGYGVLVDSPETSYFRLDQGGSWSVEVIDAPPDELPPARRPRCAAQHALLRRPEARGRARAVHRRRGPPAAGGRAVGVRALGAAHRRARTSSSPCSTSSRPPTRRCRSRRPTCTTCRAATSAGGGEAEQARTAAVHQRGLAVTTYINPMVCTDYQPVFDQAAAGGGLIENALGEPYLFQYSTNRPRSRSPSSTSPQPAGAMRSPR